MTTKMIERPQHVAEKLCELLDFWITSAWYDAQDDGQESLDWLARAEATIAEAKKQFDLHSDELAGNGGFYAVQDTDGTEDEIVIMSPDGRRMAYTLFWDQRRNPEAEQKKADALLIVEALNALAASRRAPGDAADVESSGSTSA